MKKITTVAAVQMEIKPLDMKSNVSKAIGLIDQIFKKGHCDLVVLPEDFITGPIPCNLEFAQNEESDSILEFQNIARKYNTYIVCGSIIEKIKNKYFNTSFLINNKGKVILEYRKNNLWHPERPYLTPDNTIKVVNTTIGRIGIIICWDLAFPDVCQQLAKQKVDIICCPSYWTVEDGKKLTEKYGAPSETSMVNTLCPARAIENEVLFVYANGAGKAEVNLKTKIWKGKQIGQTQICTPVFGTVKRMNNNSEGFIIYKYNRDLAKDAEDNYKIRKDLYHSQQGSL